MIRRLSLAALTLLIAMPLAAQAPSGAMMRVDRSTNAADPDDVPDVTLTPVENGMRVSTGPAVVLWEEGSTATGEYTLRANFTMEEPSDHRNYYGLVFGGSDLQAEGQNYIYFLIAQTGEYIIKHRANTETVHDIQDHMAHDAIAQPGDDGRSVNALEVRVGADQIEYVINGTVVQTTPRSGMTANTDGVYGVRVNHRLPAIVVDGLEVVSGR